MVDVGYFEFEFSDVDEAINFADAAYKSSVDGRKVSVHIDYPDKEDKED